jgi:CRISPR-associated protein Csm1
MEDKILLAALAGLLHDVGKFGQRAGEQFSGEWSDGKNKEDFGFLHALLTWQFVNKFLPDNLRKQGIETMAAYHHQLKEDDAIVFIANNLSSGDFLENGKNLDDSDRQDHPKQLQSIFCSITVEEQRISNNMYLPLEEIRLDENVIFPQPAISDDKAIWQKYKILWDAFCRATQGIKEAHTPVADLESYLESMVAIMQRYTSCIPSAYFKALPDISLYDHSRVTAAIAACIAGGAFSAEQIQSLAKDPKTFKKPVALLVRGDLSGIQKFIYRLAQPDASTEHIAKRLRGRSFYLQLLMQEIVNWLLWKLNLPSVCELMESGGRFDLLIPITAEVDFLKLKKLIQQWLLLEFQGELALNFVIEPMNTADFLDSRRTFRALDEKLEHGKFLKWHDLVQDDGFFFPQGKQWHICRVCHLTPLEEPGICPLCNQHENIGTHLPYITHIAFCTSVPANFPTDQIVRFSENSPFPDLSVLFVRDSRDLDQVINLAGRKTIFAINKPENAMQFGLELPLRFLANIAPLAKDGKFFTQGANPVDAGNVLHFEAIASLSRGAKRLGVLKADVDKLGFLMSEGLINPTLSRYLTLSRNLDLFFAGYINQTCNQTANKWLQKYGDQIQNAKNTDGLFYVMYSGGDDLFIVGPWDATLFLAQQIQQDFKHFSADNPALTISAGYVQVKPRYPTQKFAEMVDDAEKDAKNSGRNRLAAFGETAVWTNSNIENGKDNVSFEWLFDEAEKWVDAIEKGELSDGLIYDLGGLYRQHRDKNGKLRPMWTPRLYYTLARRLKPDARKKYQENIFKVIASGKTLVPVSIASLLIRERSE